MLIDPGEDGFVATLGPLAGLCKPPRSGIGPAHGCALAETRLPPRTRACGGFKLFRVAAISRASREPYLMPTDLESGPPMRRVRAAVEGYVQIASGFIEAGCLIGNDNEQAWWVWSLRGELSYVENIGEDWRDCSVSFARECSETRSSILSGDLRIAGAVPLPSYYLSVSCFLGITY